MHYIALVLSQIANEVQTTTCNDHVIQLSSASNMLASASLANTCPSLRRYTLTSDRGQRMNISLWDFNTEQSRSHGMLRDDVSGNLADIVAHGNRYGHVMTTIGNKAELQLSTVDDDTNFLLDIKGKCVFQPELIWYCSGRFLSTSMCLTSAK